MRCGLDEAPAQKWSAEASKGHDASQHQIEAGIYVQEERPHQAQQPASVEQPLLFVNMSALKGDEEMRRMFGRDIVQLRHQEDQAADLGETVQDAYSTRVRQRLCMLPDWEALQLPLYEVHAISMIMGSAPYDRRALVLIRHPGACDCRSRVEPG